MEKTLPRGLCIRRKDKNRKQSRNNYIRIRIPRVLIYSQNRANSRVRHYQQARTPPPPTATPYQHLFADNLTTLVLTHSQTRFQLPSLRCNRQISRPLISPSLSREISPSRLGHLCRTGRSAHFLPAVGLRPNRWVEVINSYPALRGSFAPRIDSSRGYLSIAWGEELDHARRIRRARLTDAVPSALCRRASRPIPAGNTAPSAGTNHS